MYSKLFFPGTESESAIEFYSYELVRVAQKIVQEMHGQIPVAVPDYSSYKEQVESEFQTFTEALVSEAASKYGIDPKVLNDIMRTFYEKGAGAIVGTFTTPFPRLREPYFRMMDLIRPQKDSIGPLITEEDDSRILPVQLMIGSSAAGLLGLAHYLHTAKEPIQGWWITVGERIILIKHTDTGKGMHLYVSDHGFQGAVLRETKDDLLSFTDQGRETALYAFNFWQFYSKLSKMEQDLLKNRFYLLLNIPAQMGTHLENEFLLYRLSLPRSLKDAHGAVFRSIGSKDSLSDPDVFPLSDVEATQLASIPEVQRQMYERIFEMTLERIRYRGEVQIPLFVRSLFEGAGGGLSSFFTQIDNIFHPTDAERYRIFFILKEIAKRLGVGLQDFLFRPLYCFGSRDEGESYRGFAEAFDRYYAVSSALSPSSLAKEMRSILKGTRLSDEQLYFLPNLIAAWFYSEAGRNNTSILSGLILLDFIEAGVVHMDGDAHNLYTWKHTLVHPRKPKDSRIDITIKDLYGNPLELGQFDGMHPMAHGKGAAGKGKGSVRDAAAKLATKEKLTPVRQKEGHLLIHWLHERLKVTHPGLSVVTTPVTTILPLSTPDYKEIDELLKDESLSRKKQKVSSLKRKWEILQIIKQLIQERLSTLDLLLSPATAGSSAAPTPIVPTSVLKSEAEDLKAAKTLSLRDAEAKGEVGPRIIFGWELHDVEDRGNCFYDAICHQMQIINHSFLATVPTTTLPRNLLRLRIQKDEFKDEEWAEDKQIDEFVKLFPDTILAIVDTRSPKNGFTYYYLDVDGSVITQTPDVTNALPERPIVRLADSGNHFLSVVRHPTIQRGIVLNAFRAFPLLYQPSPFILMLEKLRKDNLINNRHRDQYHQKRYDQQFGLIVVGTSEH